ncbi:hypothetical protein [Nitrospirillum amazonense]|uniref:Uncharacterized protein n=1 Tax=Nitrospirillum amazonense TaxID=28077 RepID=A0A560JQV4_9PROT|nr:hypothetical protein [Nitrospirillum amazonense]MDG3442185.1 hypothetical protein [Nitrospirillum amazonense]TWB73317.1 hypothetical protein FBZ87_105237 [Nitrospirillum amazonense]
MTDLTMIAATRTFTAHAGHTPRGLAAAIRHLPLLAVTALLSVAILSLF